MPKRSTSTSQTYLFARLPKDYWRIQHLLSRRADRLYHYLISCLDGRGDWTYKPITDYSICKHLKVSPSTLSHARKELIDCKLIYRKQLRRSTNIYGFNFDMKEVIKLL